MNRKLKPFVGKIITVGRYGGPEYANDFIFPEGVRKEVAYVDNKGHLNYIAGLCKDNSPCFMCGFISDLETDIRKGYNIDYIRDSDDTEIAVYIKEVNMYFNTIMKDKGRAPIAKFPLPIIDSVKMTKKWKKILINEQKI